jgi:hypothetical protein
MASDVHWPIMRPLPSTTAVETPTCVVHPRPAALVLIAYRATFSGPQARRTRAFHTAQLQVGLFSAPSVVVVVVVPARVPCRCREARLRRRHPHTSTRTTHAHSPNATCPTSALAAGRRRHPYHLTSTHTFTLLKRAPPGWRSTAIPVTRRWPATRKSTWRWNKKHPRVSTLPPLPSSPPQPHARHAHARCPTLHHT